MHPVQMEWKPPVTLALMALMGGMFFDELLPDELRRHIEPITTGCLQPYMIIRVSPCSRW